MAEGHLPERITYMTATYPIPPSARREPEQLMAASQQLLVADTLRRYGGSADLVMLGDSLTQNWQWDRSWLQRVSSGRKILNFGLGGDGIEHLLWRLEQGLVDQLQVSKAVVLIGINSIKAHSSADQIAEGIGKCLNRARLGLPSAAFLLYGVFPVRNRFPDPDPNLLIQEINRKLKMVAQSNESDFHDLGDRFQPDSAGVPASFMPDGTHLAGPAYDIWSDDLLKWLSDAKT